MAQISIYIDDYTLRQIEKAAEQEHDSVSRWVKKRLVTSLKASWPKNYFDLFGSIRDDRFKRPKQPSLKKDHKRVKL